MLTVQNYGTGTSQEVTRHLTPGSGPSLRRQMVECWGGEGPRTLQGTEQQLGGETERHGHFSYRQPAALSTRLTCTCQPKTSSTGSCSRSSRIRHGHPEHGNHRTAPGQWVLLARGHLPCQQAPGEPRPWCLQTRLSQALPAWQSHLARPSLILDSMAQGEQTGLADPGPCFPRSHPLDTW